MIIIITSNIINHPCTEFAYVKLYDVHNFLFDKISFPNSERNQKICCTACDSFGSRPHKHCSHVCFRVDRMAARLSTAQWHRCKRFSYVLMAINGCALIGWTLMLKIATHAIWFPHLHTEYSQYHARKGKFVTYRNKSGVRNQNRKLLASDIVCISNNRNMMMDFERDCINTFNI